MDFNPNSNMFEKREPEESDSLERASSEEDFEQFEYKPEAKPEIEVLKELKGSSTNSQTASVHKEDDQIIVGNGVPKINIAPSIL